MRGDGFVDGRRRDFGRRVGSIPGEGTARGEQHAIHNEEK